MEVSRKISIAPMMDCTDRHFRYFLRLITRHALLYSEMVTTGALLNGDQRKLLEFHPIEKPIAFQLGGSNPQGLGKCAELVENFGYDEVNLNVGCPSNRVQNGRIGACLMAEPDLVAECVLEMRQRVKIPVTVKSRIGIGRRDSYRDLFKFISTVAKAGCAVFIIHARSAWLNGLSPKKNRVVPPLQYDRVYQIKKDFPKLTIIINGGVTDFHQIETHLEKVDGVMIGREAYNNPYFLSQMDLRFFEDDHHILSRHKVLDSFLPYLQDQLSRGESLHQITCHLMGLFHSVNGARSWRRHLSERKSSPNDNLPDRLISAAARINV